MKTASRKTASWKTVRALWLALVPAIAFGQPGPSAAAKDGEDRELERRVAAVARRARNLEPGTPPARSAGEELESIGRAYLDRGEMGRAIELLEQSYGLDPGNGLALAELTLAHLRSGNTAFARFYLELAEQEAPRSPPQAWAALGEAYDSLHRLEDAVLAWEQFVRLGGDDPAVLRRFRAARDELSVASGQLSREAGGFFVSFDPGIPADTAEAVGARLEGKSRELAAFFQAELPGRQVVVLYAGRAYFALASVPDWVSGVFDGKIRVAMDREGGVTPELEMVLSHELAHAFLRQASRDRAPGWLHEGLAQWFEGRRISRAELAEVFRGRPVPSLSEMEGRLVGKGGRPAARVNYLEALGLVEYLIQERGPGALTCLVRELARGAPLEEALRREAGLSPSDLVLRLRAWADNDAAAPSVRRRRSAA